MDGFQFGFQSGYHKVARVGFQFFARVAYFIILFVLRFTLLWPFVYLAKFRQALRAVWVHGWSIAEGVVQCV